MATGCVSSAPAAQESSHYHEAPEGLSDAKPGTGVNEELPVRDQLEDDQTKKPRRKDTPVLNAPPHIPGVRLMKGEKTTVHVEDEEKDGKD